MFSFYFSVKSSFSGILVIMMSFLKEFTSALTLSLEGNFGDKLISLLLVVVFLEVRRVGFPQRVSLFNVGLESGGPELAV